MKLSVVIPVYSESKTIREIYNHVNAVDIDKEIILGDDFSTDGTREILESLAGEKTMVLKHDRWKDGISANICILKYNLLY